MRKLTLKDWLLIRIKCPICNEKLKISLLKSSDFNDNKNLSFKSITNGTFILKNNLIEFPIVIKYLSELNFSIVINIITNKLLFLNTESLLKFKEYLSDDKFQIHLTCGNTKKTKIPHSYYCISNVFSFIFKSNEYFIPGIFEDKFQVFYIINKKHFSLENFSKKTVVSIEDKRFELDKIDSLTLKSFDEYKGFISTISIFS